MKLHAKGLLVLAVALLVCAEALADRLCPRCNAKAESEKWIYCPLCGTRYDGTASGEDTFMREKYERVSWEKARIDYEKFNHKYVRIEVRFNGIRDHFAPVERMGITERDYVNFYFIGNWTNYIKRSNLRLVERLKRLSSYATIVMYARIEILKNPGSQDVIVVLVDDFDV